MTLKQLPRAIQISKFPQIRKPKLEPYKTKLLDAIKWLDKPRTIRIRKTTITIGVLLLYIFWPFQPKIIYADPILEHKDIKPVVTLAVAEFKPIAPLDYAVSKPAVQGAYGNPYAPGNCTWYVASRIKVPENLGNANTWASMAAADGAVVSSTPKVGAVAQNSWMSALGHVALVEAVNGGTITVSEMNVMGLGVTDTTSYPANLWTYIYF